MLEMVLWKDLSVRLAERERLRTEALAEEGGSSRVRSSSALMGLCACLSLCRWFSFSLSCYLRTHLD